LRIAPDLTSADRTFAVNVFQESKCLRRPRAFRFHNLDDGGNYFAGFFNHDGVADTNVFALDLVLVVQGCARDRAPGDDDRFKHGDRG